MVWPTSNPIAKEMDDFWQSTQSLWQQWQYEANRDYMMLTGQQDYSNTSYNINYRNQQQLQFNKVLRIWNMIGGYQRDNRLATIMVPADNDPDMGVTADEKTEVLSWIHKQDGMYEKYSDTFGGAVACGLNLMQYWMDFREDPENGDIKLTRLPFNSFIMDSYWTDPTLKTDCDRIWTRRYVTKRQLLSLVPKVEKEIPLFGKGYAAKDGKFPFLAQNWYQYQTELYSYDEYWTKDYKTKRKVLDSVTGEVADWDGTREQFQLLRRINPNVELISAQVPTIKLHVLVNNHLIYEEKEPWGLSSFPFVPMVAYHFPEVQNYAYRYQGIIRNIRDSQIELNRRRNRLLDILDAQIQSGLMVKEDALVNPEDAFFQGPGKVLYFKNSANLQTDQVQFNTPPVGSGWLELIQTIEKEIMDIVGPEELFAQNMNSKDMSSVMMKLKMGAGLTGLRNLFDNLNQAQLRGGEIIDELIMSNWGEGKVTSILGHKPSPLFFDKHTAKFRCATEEAQLTSTQRQLKFVEALQLKAIIPDAIPDDYLLEVSQIQGKKELVDRAKAKGQFAQQMQQAAAVQQMQQQQMLARSLEAKAENDFASAEERKTRAIANIGLDKERTAQAEQDLSTAILNNAKAYVELEKIEEHHLMDLARFAMDIQLAQKEINQVEDSQEVANEATREIDSVQAQPIQ